MLDLNFVRENIDIVEKKVRAKKVEFNKDEFLKLDTLRRKLITDSEALKSRKKSLAKEVGMKKSRGEDTEELQKESKDVSRKIASIENELNVIAESFKDIMLSIPNMHDDSVPVGTDEADNKVVRTWGEKPDFDFEPKPHWEIGEINKLLDFPRAAKISGARFALYMGQGAKLERELINLMLRLHTENHGYTEVLPPFMVNDASLIGTGNLPKFKEDLFKIEGNNLYMIPTAEVPLTNIHRDEMLDFKELTRKYVAYTPCFRSEAGSHGRDVRGLVRLHQFNKVELLKFTDPSKSYEELEKLTNDAEAVLQALNLHYRVVALCTGDLSFSSAKTYDLEVWMPSRNAYVEISSCSNFEDFQARRSSIKYKTPKGKKAFVHTINGSGLAAGRTVAAVLENYQTADGRVIVPQVLKDAFNGKEYLNALL